MAEIRAAIRGVETWSGGETAAGWEEGETRAEGQRGAVARMTVVS